MEVSPSISNIIKICRVCGDRASCFNFNGLTCESCKSFFRRNALKYEKFSCLKEGQCTMDPITRKCCTKCRLDKCFFIGMKKELIYSKLEKVSSSASSSAAAAAAASPTTSTSKRSQNSDTVAADDQQFLLDQADDSLNHPVHLHSKKRSKSFPLTKVELQLEEIIREKMATVSMLFPATATASEEEEEEEELPGNTPGRLAPAEGGLSKNKSKQRKGTAIELNSYELACIEEVKHAANEASFYDKTKFPVIGEVPNLIYALNLAELYIRKMIKLCKNINAFKCLTQDNQLGILKGFFTEMIIVCFSFTVIPERDGFPIIEVDENRQQALLVKLIDILYEAKKENFYHFCRQNLFRFHELLEEDTTIRDLILAKQMFKPRGESQNCAEFIRYNHFVYERLLNRYLEHKYRDISKAVERVNSIMDILSRIDQFRDILESIFLDVDSNQLALLINEIYNLK
ncbi:Ligand binding domain of hormone receptors protein [Tyrophagus putrescentiae]|nr:Ligand binding domain of hormone receptors protein [Tyrophagus putrescentiae]